MSLVKSLVKVLDRIAPLRLAEKWDNVGLLLEAPHPRPDATRVLLTIDLTTAVVEEALSSPTAFIVAYHPPIFAPLKALTLANPLQANLLRCAAAGISVYSPHTALDAVAGGINDWLCESVVGPTGLADDDATVSYVGEAQEGGGAGRIVRLKYPLRMKVLEQRIKAHLKLANISVAYTSARDIPAVRSVAICAGSGGSLLLGVDADVYLTGEMSHHEVLAAVASGKNVVLCGHTNTERGYLPTFATKIEEELHVEAYAQKNGIASGLNALKVTVSREDQHPLVLV